MPHPSRVVEVLRAALAKMNDSGAHWTKGVLYKANDNGEPMFCSLGAIMEVTGVPTSEVVRLYDDAQNVDDLMQSGDRETRNAAVMALLRAVPHPIWPASTKPEDAVNWNIITHWNDKQAEGWAEVQEVFAKAEELAMQGEAAS